jgi:hypothetical protein
MAPQPSDQDEGVIAPPDLRPGDVLLYHRESLLGRVMRAFDGSDVSHAAIFLGDDVAEAIGEGVLGRPLDVSLGNAAGDYIVVHRFDDGGPARAFDEVVGRARAYLDQHLQYGYSTVAMIAFLSLSRRIPLTGKARLLLRLILDRAAAELMAPTAGAAQRLICSEFVYRCFSEAQVPAAQAGAHAFSIAIAGATTLEAKGRNIAPSLAPDSLLERARDLWDQPMLESANQTTDEAPPPRAVDEAEIERAPPRRGWPTIPNCCARCADSPRPSRARARIPGSNGKPPCRGSSASRRWWPPSSARAICAGAQPCVAAAASCSTSSPMPPHRQ